MEPRELLRELQQRNSCKWFRSNEKKNAMWDFFRDAYADGIGEAWTATGTGAA